jgi:DNA-binding NtrC family response regulator
MRPIILVVDPPDPEALSTRKLVLESAKYNVMTAFTGEEAIEIARKVPLDAAVVHRGVADANASQLVAELKKLLPQTAVVMVTPHKNATAPEADYILDSYQPMTLVDLFFRLFGRPDYRGNTPAGRETGARADSA